MIRQPQKDECIRLYNEGILTIKEIMAETGEAPDKIVEEKGLKQVTDTGAIEAIVDEVIASSPENVASYKAGKVNLLGWFVGQVIKKSQGKANPAIVNKLLSEKLAK